MRRLLPWLWLCLVISLFLGSGLVLVHRIEREALDRLETEMVSSGQAFGNLWAADLAAGKFKDLPALASPSRVRVLDARPRLLADSLGVPVDQQASLAFRPEIGRALQGGYSAYTRFSDETERSLALFVAVPVYFQGQVVGVVYLSHSTDDILQSLGRLRSLTRDVLAVVVFGSLLLALYLSGHLHNSLRRLRLLTGEARLISIQGSGPEAEIGHGFNRLVQSLQEKVTLLEEEKAKTRRFFEDVAHELKTPVTGLCGSLEALQTAPDQRLLHNALRESRRLSELVARLMELQQLEYYDLRLETFELTSLLQTALDPFEFEAARKGVRLDIHTTEELRVRGDAGKLLRAVENLIDNAVRCTPPGGHVEVEARAQGEQIWVYLRDEGPGLDPALLGRNQRQGAPAAMGSLGLGLAVAAEVLRMHGSPLEATGRPDGGTELRFRLGR